MIFFLQKPRQSKMEMVTLMLLAISAISFCFFLGFPFLNHNESYLWLAQFRNMTFIDVVTHQISPVATLRPFGTVLAWTTYHFTGDIFFQELINYAFVIGSVLVMFWASENKPLYALLSLIFNGVFFSGYIYLFHLHGVFYGPFQLFFSVLVSLVTSKKNIDSKTLFLIVIFGLAASLFHTFSLIILMAFFSGLSVQSFSKRIVIVTVLVVILCVSLSKLLSPSFVPQSGEIMLNGFFASFKSVEIGPIQSFIAGVLGIFLASEMLRQVRMKVLFCVVVGLIAVVFFLSGIPVLLLWVCLCIVLIAIKRNWPLFFISTATLVFPVFTGSGSPTYSVFILFLCLFVTSNRAIPLFYRIVILKSSSLIILALVLCFVLIKGGVFVPGVSQSVRPLLAEKEKTFQLENIIRWRNESANHTSLRLVLFSEAKFPVNSKDAGIDRKNRAPTNQSYLDAYNAIDRAKHYKTLFVTFGNQQLASLRLVYKIGGQYSGDAFVFEQ